MPNLRARSRFVTRCSAPISLDAANRSASSAIRSIWQSLLIQLRFVLATAKLLDPAACEPRACIFFAAGQSAEFRWSLAILTAAQGGLG